MDLTPKRIDPEYAEAWRRETEQSAPEGGRVAAAHEEWMRKLSSGDYSGPVIDVSRYLSLRNQKIHGNPRQTEEYRDQCAEAVGVGKVPDPKR